MNKITLNTLKKVLKQKEMKNILGGSGYLYCKFWMDGAGPIEGYCGTNTSEAGCCNDLIAAYGSGYKSFHCTCE